MINVTPRLLGLALALPTFLALNAPALAADHRDSPTVDDDPAADINDVYMFRDPANSNNLVLVLSTYPLGNPRFATTYQYDPDVIFQIRFDTVGKGVFSKVVTAQFSPLPNGPGSQQNVTVTMPNGTVVTGPVTLPTNKSTALNPVITSSNGVSVFAGQRDDPFFFDLIGFNRVVAKINATSVNGGPGVADTTLFTHVDAFAGFNVEALVIEAPISDFVGSSTKFGISAFSFRKLTPGVRSTASPPLVTFGGVIYGQVDRMGNPAVNTAFITPALKDSFNISLPQNDSKTYASTILAMLKKYGTNSADTAVLASIVLPDTLKIDLTKPDGYPNGRQLSDDVIDTLLQLVFNQPLGGGFGDGVDGNDEPYLSTFPYVGVTHTDP